MRTYAFLLAVLGLGMPLAAQPVEPVEPADTSRRVTVTAEGYNRDDALKQALRKALEKGAGVEIAAQSQVRDFALIRDTIYSRASGIVSEYNVLKEEKIAGGLWAVMVEAVVRPDAVARTWGEVQNVLGQIGRPKIMVWIDEKIDGRQQNESIVAGRIEQMFLKAGFELVERKAVDEVRRRETGDALDEKDAAKLARLAKDAGAHILIRGSARADQSGLRDVYGARVAFYSCSVQAKIYYTDTGKLLVSESIPARERGLRSHSSFSPQAARAALVAATFPDTDARREPVLAVRLFESVMEQWATAISAGGTIELEVEGLEFKTFVNLKRALSEIDNVGSVDGDFSKGAGLFRLQTMLSAQTLAERLIEKPFDEWLEVVDLKPNRIQSRAVRR